MSRTPKSDGTSGTDRGESRRGARHGYGRDVVRLVADLVRAAGEELLTSHVPDPEAGPGPFYARLGFVPTGDLDEEGEIILRLDLRDQ